MKKVHTEQRLFFCLGRKYTRCPNRFGRSNRLNPVSGLGPRSNRTHGPRLIEYSTENQINLPHYREHIHARRRNIPKRNTKCVWLSLRNAKLCTCTHAIHPNRDLGY